MKFDFPKKIRSGYLAVFLLLVLCYFLSLSSFIQLRKQNKWVGHTREVINKLAILNSNLKDAEISWNEFMLKKQKVYLAEYKESQVLVDSVFKVLSISVSDNPEEKKRLESMHNTIVLKYNTLNEELAILNRNNFQINDSIRTREQLNTKLINSIEQVSDSITV